MRAERVQELRRIYLNPKTGFVGKGKFLLNARECIPDLKKEEVDEFYAGLEIQQVHERPKHRNFMPVYTFTPLEIWEADLIDFSQFRGVDGNRYAYVLIVIDFFTKEVFTRNLFTKFAAEVGEAFRSIMDSVRRCG